VLFYPDVLIFRFVQDALLGGNGYPNTYTFTKYLTENWLRSRRGRIPMAIYRPSIIGSAWAVCFFCWPVRFQSLTLLCRSLFLAGWIQ
jgi:hypothetical protein